MIFIVLGCWSLSALIIDEDLQKYKKLLVSPTSSRLQRWRMWKVQKTLFSLIDSNNNKCGYVETRPRQWWNLVDYFFRTRSLASRVRSACRAGPFSELVARLTCKQRRASAMSPVDYRPQLNWKHVYIGLVFWYPQSVEKGFRLLYLILRCWNLNFA